MSRSDHGTEMAGSLASAIRVHYRYLIVVLLPPHPSLPCREAAADSLTLKSTLLLHPPLMQYI